MWPWIGLGVAGAVLVVVLASRPLRGFFRTVNIERARELFKLQRERLEAQFIKAASATGKPRGLRWKDCQWESEVEFVRNKKNGEIAALAGVTILFEAVEGSDMEGLPAVSNPRNASAVFFYHRGQWQTVGKAIFNMNPNEAIAHFQAQYERVQP
jgi:hypothetical protein